MLLVFLRKNDHCTNLRPFDAKRWIVKLHTAVDGRTVRIIAFVGKERIVFEHDKTVCESSGNEELLFVLARERHREILTVGRRVFTDVDRHVPDRTADPRTSFA